MWEAKLRGKKIVDGSANFGNGVLAQSCRVKGRGRLCVQPLICWIQDGEVGKRTLRITLPECGTHTFSQLSETAKRQLTCSIIERIRFVKRFNFSSRASCCAAIQVAVRVGGGRRDDTVSFARSQK